VEVDRSTDGSMLLELSCGFPADGAAAMAPAGRGAGAGRRRALGPQPDHGSQRWRQAACRHGGINDAAVDDRAACARGTMKARICPTRQNPCKRICTAVQEQDDVQCGPVASALLVSTAVSSTAVGSKERSSGGGLLFEGHCVRWHEKATIVAAAVRNKVLGQAS